MSYAREFGFKLSCVLKKGVGKVLFHRRINNLFLTNNFVLKSNFTKGYFSN